MGKDRSKDGDAATSSTDNKDPSRDQESRDAALARTIAEAVALQTKSIVEMFSRQKAEERQSIIEMFSKQKAEETQSITEAFSRQMEKMHAQYEELLKASHTQTFLLPLRLLPVQKVLELWTPLTGQWTKTSTRDGSYGHTRLDLY